MKKVKSYQKLLDYIWYFLMYAPGDRDKEPIFKDKVEYFKAMKSQLIKSIKEHDEKD